MKIQHTQKEYATFNMTIIYASIKVNKLEKRMYVYINSQYYQSQLSSTTSYYAAFLLYTHIERMRGESAK